MTDKNSDNTNKDDEVAVVPGTDEFAKMLFKLNQPVTADNLSVLDYNGGHLQPVQDDLYAMPAFVTDDFNLFFIVSQLVEEDWVIAFSNATIEKGNEITDLSEPMTTGKGLNMLGQKSLKMLISCSNISAPSQMLIVVSGEWLNVQMVQQTNN